MGDGARHVVHDGDHSTVLHAGQAHDADAPAAVAFHAVARYGTLWVTWSSASGTQDGVTAGVDRDGALLVRIGDRVERIVGGEVQWT